MTNNELQKQLTQFPGFSRVTIDVNPFEDRDIDAVQWLLPERRHGIIGK